MDPKDLVIGKVYFTLGFVGRGQHKPVITTYEYIEEATVEKGYFEAGFRFKPIPHFWYYDENGKKVPTDEAVFFRPKQIRSMLTLSGLITELSRLARSENE